VEQFFSRRSWKEVKGRELLGWQMASRSLFHLTPEAPAYYLPAYMTAFLTERVDPIGYALLGTLLSVLTPPADRPSVTFAGRHADTRSLTQKDAMSRAGVDRFT